MDLITLAWTPEDYKAFQNELFRLADPGYREFTAKSVFTDRPLLGVRLPVLRALAKPIAKSPNYPAFLAHDPVSVEEVLARGFVIGHLPYEAMLDLFPTHLPHLDNWETVDCYAASLKAIKKHRQDFYDRLLEPLLTKSETKASSNSTTNSTATASPEFTTRLALVLLLDHYINPDFLHVIFDHALRLKSRNEYYVKMALAWLLAETFVHFPDETTSFLETAALPRWTHNKTISKICDSYRVDPATKAALKSLRR